MRLLWFCGVPRELEQMAFGGQWLGAVADWSWIMGHLPPPAGVELHIACPAKGLTSDRQVVYKGTKFHLFPSPFASAYRFYLPWHRHFRRIYEDVHPDWVHGWGTEAGFGSAALAVCPERNVVGIQGLLGEYWSYLPWSIPLFIGVLNEFRTLRKARRLMAESRYSRDATRRYTYGQIVVVPQPLRDRFICSDVGPRSRENILFLGNLCAGKGIEDALQAFANVKSSDWSLTCVGEADQQMGDKIRAFIQRMNLQARVQLVGRQTVDQIVTWLQDSPVLLLPSYMDTGPTALKEALAMGVWPLCYDNTGPEELIRTYGVGTLVPTGDVPALGRTLAGLLAEQPWLDRPRLSAAVARIRHDLCRETVWARLLAAYRGFADGEAP